MQYQHQIHCRSFTLAV